jgi:arylsulfatase
MFAATTNPGHRFLLQAVDDRDYQVPFAFTGKIDKLTIALDEPKLTPDDVQKLETAYRAAQDAN